MKISVLSSWWSMSLVCHGGALGTHLGQKRYGLTKGGETWANRARNAFLVLALGAAVAGVALSLVLR